MKLPKKIAADGICIIVAVIWGAGFVASQIALKSNMSPALIMMFRFTVAAIVMLTVCAITGKLKRVSKNDLRIGILAGLVLFGAFFTQIIGQSHTTVSHSAFLTATNVIMIPFLIWIIKRHRPGAKVFALTFSTFIGICILSVRPDNFTFSFNFGDFMTLICALMFAMHITVLGFLKEDSDVMLVNLIQLMTAALISVILFAATDINSFVRADFAKGLPAILYLGLFSTCLCYFLQTAAQKYTGSAQAGVLLSTEGLFGSAFSVLLGMEPFTLNMAIGGLLIFVSVVCMEIPDRKRS